MLPPVPDAEEPEANVTEPLSPTVAVPVDKDNDPLSPDVPASSDERLTSPDEVSTPLPETQVSSIATTRRTSIERSCTPSIAEESPATSDIDPPLSDDEALPMTLKLPPAASPEPTLNTMLPPVPDAEEPEANVTEPLSPTVAVPVDKDNDPLTPDVPASSDERLTSPDEVSTPLPEVIVISPPKEDDPSPPISSTEPPLTAPLPDDRLKSPPSPPLDEPALKEAAPHRLQRNRLLPVTLIHHCLTTRHCQ
eukprot:g8854.t1 g8854   contig34:278917-279761(+)